MDLKLREYIVLLLVLMLSSGCGTDSTNDIGQYLTKTPDSNLLIVSFDALRADAIGVYNSRMKTSPNMDTFSAHALIFNKARSGGTVTPTSFASAFTGCYPYKSFVGWNVARQETIANLFKKKGYRTIFYTDNIQLLPKWKFDQGFDDYHVIESGRDEDLLPMALASLEKNRSRKFFAWFHFLSPHGPYSYRNISKKFYSDDYHGRFEKEVPAIYKVENESDLKRAKEMYDGEVFFADYIFGRVLSKIKELGLSDKTVIVLTSDHGEEFLEHGGTGHDNLFEEGARIPFLISNSESKHSVRTDTPYSNVDLLPTLASIFELKPPAGIDGVSLAEQENWGGRPIFSFSMTSPDKVGFDVIANGYKLMQVCEPVDKQFLFDLSASGENDNLIHEKNSVENELIDEALSKIGGSPCEIVKKSMAGQAPLDKLSRSQLEHLKSLGYAK